jgi:hypothetical protein
VLKVLFHRRIFILTGGRSFATTELPVNDQCLYPTMFGAFKKYFAAEQTKPSIAPRGSTLSRHQWELFQVTNLEMCVRAKVSDFSLSKAMRIEVRLVELPELEFWSEGWPEAVEYAVEKAAEVMGWKTGVSSQRGVERKACLWLSSIGDSGDEWAVSGLAIFSLNPKSSGRPDCLFHLWMSPSVAKLGMLPASLPTLELWHPGFRVACPRVPHYLEEVLRENPRLAAMQR